ncbi:hypothetical protein [Paraburkholderia strydomiana]|uniref:hypothetical protein n=1 Tax=Paraburkholderia strydomiana TaxID=1245417 RepID=UPI001BE67537|nr:hypothetical protein [Paraburkholderia strydomiana]MBT2791703.1 hypothetical protein [Paraburkholderia strydomiana]
MSGVVKPRSGKVRLECSQAPTKALRLHGSIQRPGGFISTDSTVSHALFSISIFIGLGVILSTLLHLNKWTMASLMTLMVVAASRPLLQGQTSTSELESILQNWLERAAEFATTTGRSIDA